MDRKTKPKKISKNEVPGPVEIIRQITELALKYEALYACDNDIKALMGLERCLEMKMKVLGMDGKTQPNILTPAVTDTENSKISITELPTQTIEQILKTIKTMKQQKQ